MSQARRTRLLQILALAVVLAIGVSGPSLFSRYRRVADENCRLMELRDAVLAYQTLIAFDPSRLGLPPDRVLKGNIDDGTLARLEFLPVPPSIAEPDRATTPIAREIVADDLGQRAVMFADSHVALVSDR